VQDLYSFIPVFLFCRRGGLKIPSWPLANAQPWSKGNRLKVRIDDKTLFAVRDRSERREAALKAASEAQALAATAMTGEKKA
jgi:hypothetical protein